jgi:hypothetical protein
MVFSTSYARYLLFLVFGKICNEIINFIEDVFNFPNQSKKKPSFIAMVSYNFTEIPTN